MKKGKFFLLAVVSIFFYSCGVAEFFDSEDVVIEGTAEPELTIPVVKTELKLEDLVEEKTDTIEYKDDGNGRKIIRFVYRDNDLADFSTKDLYDEPELPSVSEEISFGTQTLSGDLTKSQTIKLGTLIDQMENGNGKTALNAAVGNPLPIPAFPPVSAGNVNFPGLDDFNEATFESGTIEVTFDNNMPFPMTVLLELQQKNGTKIDDITFNDVPANSSKTEIVDLANKTLTSELIGVIKEFSSTGTGTTAVTLNRENDNFKLTVAIKNPVIRSGSAKLPAKTFEPTITDASFGEGDLELKKVRFKSAVAQFTLKSDVEVKLNYSIKFQGITEGGDKKIVTGVADFTQSKTQSFTVDFSNLDIDLGTKDPFYNVFPIEFESSIPASTGFVQFNSTNKFSVEATFDNFEIDYVQGYFGKQEVTIDTETFNIDDEALDNLDGIVKLNDPTFTLLVSNKGIGVPFSLDFNLQRDNVKVEKNATINTPNDHLSEAPTDITLDKNTPNFIDLLTLPFTEVSYGGKGGMNVDGVKDHTQFISGDSEVKIGAEVIMPLHLTVENLSLSDTIDMDLSDADEVEEFTKVFIEADVKNGFPFRAKLLLHFLDKDSKSRLFTVGEDSSEGLLLEAPKVENGVVPVGTSADSKIKIELTGEQLSLLKKVGYVDITAEINTSDSDDGVKIYTDYMIEVSLKVGAGVKIDYSELND